MQILPNKISKLTLVGAGPGDPDLITLKGIKAIKDADVILYDALIDSSLLDFAKKDVIKIFVGKRGGKNYMKQEEINQLIIQKAFDHGHVVRLKGGDPFVFGRGHEEMEYAKSFGIETAIVPGISSAIAVPEMQEIPVTKRGISESFWVITATTKKGAISNDLLLAAQSTATIIILMGMNKLPEIISVFEELGKSDTPIAIIQNGTTANEKIAIGTIDTILANATENKLGSPAIILIGEVVNEHPSVVEKALEHISNK